MASIRFILILLLSSAAVGRAQSVADLPGCGQTCANSMIQDKAASLGCPGGAFTCLCANTQFLLGLHDCAVGACSATTDPSALVAQVDRYGVALCASATAPPTPSSTAPPTTALATPSATSVATTSAVSTPAVVPGSVTQSTGPASLPTTSPSTVTPALVATSSTSSVASTTTAAPASVTSSTASGSSDVATPGLTTTAKVGLGIGVAAGGVAMIALAACVIITRRHKRKNRDSRLQISDPLPGSGRTYANDHHHKQYETGKSELEMKSRRYEDMVPRQSPRTMV